MRSVWLPGEQAPHRRPAQLTPLRLCPVCFDDFQPEGRHHRYCTTSCKDRGAYRRRHRTWEADIDFTPHLAAGIAGYNHRRRAA